MYNPYGYNQGFQNPYQSRQDQFAPRLEIIHVNGENGARALQMAPNSNALLMDDTAPIVWLAQSDGAGYKTVTPFTITPYKQETAESLVQALEVRIKKLEDAINAKSDDVPIA